MRFVSTFWEEMISLLGKNLQFNIAFHPMTDGKSEVTICMLQNFLEPYIEHYSSVWTVQLLLVRFVANNVVDIRTTFAPFYLNSG